MHAVNSQSTFQAPPSLGEYEIVGGLARGGMATVFLARRAGEAGFQRLFAVKVLHPHLADDSSFVEMLLDEARIAALIHHPNVVPIIDLGSQGGFHYVVMEYVEGCSFAALLTQNRDQRPPRLIVPIVLDALAGLHAAHSLVGDDGKPLNLVHRDVSPQNIMIGVDGASRITDFGVARAEARVHSTRPGQLKGKIAFMSPEQIVDAAHVDQRADIFSAGVLLWTALTGRRLFLGKSDAATLNNILRLDVPRPSSVGLNPPEAFDAVCLKALSRNPEERFASAAEMEEALREAALSCGAFGARSEVGTWVKSAFGSELDERRSAIRSAVSSRLSVTNEAAPSVSGMRMIPTVGAVQEADTPSGSGGALTPQPRSSPSQAPTVSVALAAPPPPQKGKKLLWAVAGIAAAVLVGGVALATLGTSTVAAAPTPSKAEPPTAAPSAPEPAAESPSPKPEKETAAAPEPSAEPEPKPSAEPAKPAANPRQWARPAAPKPAKPAASAKPATPEPTKKPKAWDNDSPTLPP